MGRREDIEARLRQLEAEYARLSRFPATDVFADGTIMTWQTRTRETTYNYAAIRGNDLWWSTGPVTGGQRSRSYDELLNFIGNGTNVRVIDPDVGVELDELVIEEGDDGTPWRDRVKEARNAVSNELAEEFTETGLAAATAGWVQPPSARELLDGGPVTTNPPAGTFLRTDDLAEGGPVRRPWIAGDPPQ